MYSSNWFYYRLFYKQIRQFSLNYQLNRTHYDSLGVTKNATQADIKSAYYKLSMLYHPDKNTDSVDSSKKFRDITEAYQVLGNVRTRKLYDRGLLIDTVRYDNTAQDDELVNKFYKSRETRSKPPAPTGRTVVYDFDEWTRSHYGATFARDMRNKERRQKQENFRKIAIADVKSERMLAILAMFFFFCVFVLNGQKDMDRVQTFGDNIRSTKND